MDQVHHRMSVRSRRPWLGFRPTACGNTRETSFRPASAKDGEGRRFVTPRQTCPRPEGLGRNLRSKTRWFTGFCNSHQVSHFATFFIDARAEISVAESRFRLQFAAQHPPTLRLRGGECQPPKTVGVAIPIKATFFITYIMVDGWAGIAGEILRLKPLIFFHIKNSLLVKTEKDREEAMNPGQINYHATEPRIQLYFLLGLVYAPVTPVLLPFIIIFFALAYLVFRHQIINVYNQEYESAARFWPDVHGRIISALIIAQILLMGLLSTKGAAQSTPFLLFLPIITFFFHRYCKGRYEPAFLRHPLKEAMVKDTLERAREPNFNLKPYLQKAYIHPVFKDNDYEDSRFDEISGYCIEDSDEECVTVPTKRQSRINTPAVSHASRGSSRSPPSK